MIFLFTRQEGLVAKLQAIGEQLVQGDGETNITEGTEDQERNYATHFSLA